MVLLWMLAAFVAGYLWAMKQDSKYIKFLEESIDFARNDPNNAMDILSKAHDKVLEHHKNK